MIRAEDIAADGAYRHLKSLRGVPHDLRYACLLYTSRCV